MNKLTTDWSILAEKTLGGTSIIPIGDSFQLQPVIDGHLCKEHFNTGDEIRACYALSLEAATEVRDLILSPPALNPLN